MKLWEETDDRDAYNSNIQEEGKARRRHGSPYRTEERSHDGQPDQKVRTHRQVDLHRDGGRNHSGFGPTAEASQATGHVTALVVMTPTGPATCSTWVQWRLPAANPADKAAIEYWTEGYLSGLAAGSHHDVIGQFRREALAAWLDRYCTANPQTPLPLAINALGIQMLAHPGGPL